MPFSGNAWDDSKMVPYRAALRTILQRFPDLRPLAPRPNDTARVSPSSCRPVDSCDDTAFCLRASYCVYDAGVAGAGARGYRGVHRVHDAALLRLLQPPAPHRRRESQGS